MSTKIAFFKRFGVGTGLYVQADSTGRVVFTKGAATLLTAEDIRKARKEGFAVVVFRSDF